MATNKQAFAALRPARGPAPFLQAELRGFELSYRPGWQDPGRPGAKKTPLGLGLATLEAKLHIHRNNHDDPRTLRLAFLKAIAAGAVELEMPDALSFVGHVEGAWWLETRNDRGEFSGADLTLILVGKES